MPQGSVLDLSLFLIFIDNMAVSNGTTICLFADDNIVYRSTQSADDTVQLNQDLYILQAWETDARMKFNAKKCEN